MARHNLDDPAIITLLLLLLNGLIIIPTTCFYYIPTYPHLINNYNIYIYILWR